MDSSNAERIDPDGKCSQGELRHFEHIAIQVLDLLPDADMERTRDCIQVTESDERGIVVLVTPDAVEIRLPTVEWLHVHTPVASSRLKRRISLSKLIEGSLAKLIGNARKARQDEFQECFYCKTPTPPEHAHTFDDKHVCHGCSERELGVVH